MRARATGTAPASARAHRRVVVLERDPYLAFLIRQHAPEADVVEADETATLDEVLDHDPDLVVAGMESSSVPIASLLDAGRRTRVLAVVDGARAARSVLPSAIHGVLARPFAPADVARAVRTALRLAPGAPDPRASGPTLERVRAAIPAARVGALALTAVLEISGGEVSRARAAMFALAFAYAALRWAWRRPSIVADAASDIAVAVILLAATGGLSSNFTPFAAVAAASAGLMQGPRWGVIGGLSIVCGSVPIITGALSAGSIQVRDAVVWASLFPLLGVAGGFAARVWRKPDTEGLDVLIEANRVLSSLYRIARTLPGGLEIGSVADATVNEIGEAIGARAGAMLLADAGTFAVVGSFGVEDPTALTVRDGLASAIHGEHSVLKTADLHPATAAALGAHECWLAAPMDRDGIAHGVLLAACPAEERHEANLLLLRRLADEATVSVENARLFSRVREISIDEERRRLARDLHDGVAQSLTHLRYELDFLVRNDAAPEPVLRDVRRLTRVVDRTSREVRSMILGLRSAVHADGLSGSLQSYLADLQRLGGPAIEFDARGEVVLPPDTEGEIFRIAQEAVSNALRHAGATEIHVRLEMGHTHVRLIVEDDGTGVVSTTSQAGGGVGLEAMRERAELIDAKLEIGPRAPRGTRVVLDHTIGGKR